MLPESPPQTWDNIAINISPLILVNCISPFNAKHFIVPAPMHLTIMFVVMRALSLSRARAYSTVSHVGSSLSVTAARGLPGGQMSEFLAGIACIALHCKIKKSIQRIPRWSTEAANTPKIVLYCKSSSQASILLCIQCSRRVHVHVHAEHGVCVRRGRHPQDGGELRLILSTRKL